MPPWSVGRPTNGKLVVNVWLIWNRSFRRFTAPPPASRPKNYTTRNRTSGAEMVQFSPRRIQEVESLLAERELWMTVGDVALARHQNLQPHRRVSLSIVARLFELASELGRLAVAWSFAQVSLMNIRQMPTRRGT